MQGHHSLYQVEAGESPFLSRGVRNGDSYEGENLEKVSQTHIQVTNGFRDSTSLSSIRVEFLSRNRKKEDYRPSK